MGEMVEIEEQKCQFCGKKARNFLFAAFVCDSEECISKAREARGGPGGHMKWRDLEKRARNER